MLGRRHDLSRNLIRIWVEKAEAGELDQDVAAADLLGAYEAKIAALERLVGQQALEIEFLKGAQKIAPSPSRRAHLRDHRPDGLSVERGCALMGLPRSTFYAAPRERPSDDGAHRRDPRHHRRVRVLRLPPGRRRAAPPRPGGQRQEAAPADAGERAQPPERPALRPHHRQRPRRADLPLRGAGLRGHGPTSSGWRTSPTSRSRRASSISPSILDAWSRRVVGHALARNLEARHSVAALARAIALRRPPPGCVFHSDRGVQYASGAHRALLAAHGLTGSMSRRGNPYDNAKAESFMKTLKVEAVYLDRVRHLRGGRRRPAPLHRGGLQRHDACTPPWAT